MTPATFKAIRLRVGLTQSQLAEFLRISDKRTVRYWETGERAISGPVSIVMELLSAGMINPGKHITGRHDGEGSET